MRLTCEAGELQRALRVTAQAGDHKVTLNASGSRLFVRFGRIKGSFPATVERPGRAALIREVLAQEADRVGRAPENGRVIELGEH